MNINILKANILMRTLKQEQAIQIYIDTDYTNSIIEHIHTIGTNKNGYSSLLEIPKAEGNVLLAGGFETYGMIKSYNWPSQIALNVERQMLHMFMHNIVKIVDIMNKTDEISREEMKHLLKELITEKTEK